MKIINYKYIPLLCLLGLMISCESSQKEKGVSFFGEKDFKEHSSLTGEVVKLNELNKPADICVIPEKNLLLLIDMEGDYFIKAYQLNSMNYIKSFAKKGNGPGQLLSCQLQNASESGLLYVTDFYKKKIYTYAVDSILLKTNTTYPLSSITIQTKFLNYPLVLNNDKIVDFCNNFKSPKVGVLGFFSHQGLFLNNKGNYPQIKKKYQPIELNEVFTGGLAFSKSNEKIIYNYYYTDFIDIYDTSGKLQKRAHGPDIFDPDLKSESVMGSTSTGPTKDARRGYTGRVKMKDSTLLVLYDGKPVSNMDYHTHKLFLFNQNLTPEKIYNLNEGIFGFDIDWNTNTLYGLTHKSKSSIIKYKLK